MDLITFVQKLFAEDTRLQHMDIEEGSNIYDLLVKPLAIILEERINDEILEGTSNKLDLSLYTTMAYEELVKFARNHFIEVPEDNITRGEVYFHLSDPVDIDILAGAILYAGDKQFELVYDISFSESDYYYVDGLYKSPSISVKNTDGQTVEANIIGSIDGAPAQLIKITHLAMNSGIAKKTATEMFGKILGALSANHYISERAIQKALNRACGVNVKVEVVGYGDEFMTRSIVYNMSGPNNQINEESGFYGKIRGKSDTFVYNVNKAFKIFVDSIGGVLTEEDGLEFLQEEYIKISNADGNDIQITTDSVIEEKFGLSSEVGGEQKVISTNAVATDLVLELANVDNLEAGQMIKIISYDVSGNKERPTLNVIREVDALTSIITLYTKISKDIVSTTTPSPYIEVMETAGYSLGHGWIRSEDGMSLGRTLSEQEIMVVDGKLMLGIPDTDFGGNIVVETLIKMGIDNFLSAIRKAVKIQKVPKLKEKSYPNIPVSEMINIGGTK